MPPDDADVQTFVATHLLFSHLMAFDSKKNTLSQLENATTNVLGAKIRSQSRKQNSRVSPSRAGSPPGSRFGGRSPNVSMQRQSYQALSRSTGVRVFPDYYSSPPGERVRSRGQQAPEVVRFAQNLSTIQKAKPGRVPEDQLLRESAGTQVLNSSGKFKQTFNQGKIERMVPYIPEQEDLPKNIFAEKTATFRPTASPKYSTGTMMSMQVQDMDSKNPPQILSSNDEPGLQNTRRQGGAPMLITTSNDAYEHSPNPLQGVKPELTSQDYMTSQDQRMSGQPSGTAGYLEPTPMSGLSGGTIEEKMMA